ncbi:hypothetical protein Nepgr_018870 [Nepenthes gracilis]|uniref:Uncharacterized protein n=1 Tax=Nepenthes gracilis TaxID=150966 RepID=A0AAD3SUM5_NEPGR|nr:hypothetical protein Nepgr_018870 [Nepenthes gracilis]
MTSAILQGDHRGEDQRSCNSLGMLRRNIEVFRTQFEIPSPRADVDYSITRSRQDGMFSLADLDDMALMGIPVPSLSRSQYGQPRSMGAAVRFGRRGRVGSTGHTGSYYHKFSVWALACLILCMASIGIVVTNVSVGDIPLMLSLWSYDL